MERLYRLRDKQEETAELLEGIVTDSLATTVRQYTEEQSRRAIYPRLPVLLLELDRKPMWYIVPGCGFGVNKNEKVRLHRFEEFDPSGRDGELDLIAESLPFEGERVHGLQVLDSGGNVKTSYTTDLSYIFKEVPTVLQPS